MSNNEKNIKLIEVCDTWQGEGPNTGKQMLLVRFKDCNRRCPFCDTSVRMRTAHSGFYSTDDINKALSRSRSIMITGGEPTFDSNYESTKLLLKECDYEIANVETNGYKLIELVEDCKSERISTKDETRIINFIWSPKFFDEIDYHEATKILQQIYNQYNVYIKIVVVSNLLERIEKFLEYSISRLNSGNRIYLMVEGTTKEEINKNWDICIELADKYNCNISSRMHIVHGFI